MGFAQEMKDFASGFQATAGIGQKISDRRAKRDLTRSPTEEELAGMPGIPDGSGSIPQVQTDSTTTGSTKLGNAGGEGFLQQAYGYYRQKGLGHAQAAGIAGNLNLESGHGDPRVLAGVRRGDAGSAAYAGQWRDKRLANLEQYAGGKPTLQQQLDFVLEEGNPNSPYVDTTWANAMPKFMAAQTPDEATALFMNHFERPAADPKVNAIAQRTAWANSLADTGGGAARQALASSDIALPMDTAIPEPETAAADPAAQDASSAEPGIVLPPEEEVPTEVPVVQADWTQQPLYAAQGGVIPEPHYAPGGTVDPYNAARAYTQPVPQPAANTFVPRRVGMPNPTAAPSGPTPSQIAFRQRPVTPPVMPTQTTKKQDVAAPTRFMINFQQPDGGTGDRQGSGHQFSPFGGRPITFSNMSELDPRIRRYVEAYPSKATVRPVDAAFKMGNHTSPFFGVPGYEEGGVIPEVNFAEGGKVSRFDELLREESRGSGAGGISGNARDRAAKRLSREEGRATSSAYSAADDTEYFKPVKAKPKVQRQAATSPARTPAPAPAATPAPAAAAPQGVDPRVAEMGDRQPAAPPAPDVATLAGAREAGKTAGAMVGRPHMGPPIPLPERNPMAAENQTLPAPPGPQPVAADLPVIPERIDTRPAPSGATPAAPSVAAAPPAPVPVIPERIDTRPAPTGATPAPPAVATGADHAGMIKAAVAAIAGGQDPKTVGQGLLDSGVSMELWPMQLQNMFLGFAEGGVIPDQRQSWHTGGSTPGVQYNDPGTQPAAQEPEEDVAPTPKLMKDVSIALDGGVKFLTDHFGLRGQGAGAIPTREDQAQPQAAASRFAQGEGASTPEEIQGVDNVIDPDRRLSEGKRHLARLAKTVQWYQQQNRPKDAKAAAGSLLQYGAQRFGQLGSLAGAAYKEYQQSNNPQDLQHAIKFMEQAYEMIPDGADLQIALDPASKTLVATRTTADGEEVQFDITPDQIPQLIQGAQSKSAYWKSVLAMADPAGARQQAGFEHSDRVKAADRRYQEQAATVRDERASARAEKTALAIDARGAARDAAREKAALAKEQRADTLKNPNYETVNPLLAAADAAKTALDASPDDEALKTAYNQAASALYDALPKGAPKAQFMRDNGHEREMWTYVKAPAAEAGAPEPGARKAADGFWYKPDPARSGKYVKLEPTG